MGIKGVILAATLAASAAFAAGLLPLLVAMTASPRGAALAVDPASLIREASALNSSGNAKERQREVGFKSCDNDAAWALEASASADFDAVVRDVHSRPAVP